MLLDGEMKYLEECVEMFTKMRSVMDMRVDDMGEYISDAMTMVEKYNDLTGFEKRSLAVKVVCVILRRHTTSVASENVDMFERIGPGMVDVIVRASKGELKINARSLLRKLFGCVLRFFRSKKIDENMK
jgi:hypothetical protein